MKHIENVARGYKAAIKNRNVSNEGREHARQELDRLQSNDHRDVDIREPHVKGGLKAATHNPNVTDEAKQQARGRLESMGEHPDQPAD